MSRVKKSAEQQIKALFARHTYPPLEVIIPILEKAGRGEQELTAQIYDTETSVANGVKEILNLKEKNMKTLAKVFSVMLGHEGTEFEPIELSETRFSFSVSDCPMLHVGRDVSMNVKGKFCDLICSAGAKAITTAVLGQESACYWDKSLIKGAGKCKVAFETRKAK
jgi:hypothetical protein